MKEDRKIIFIKQQTLKSILNDSNDTKNIKKEKQSNTKELSPKSSIELYIPMSYEKIKEINKKTYRDLKIKKLKNHLKETLINLKIAIETYKELINRTEFWERKSTFNFNFTDWNTIKKVNGKITRYYNDILKIERNLQNENQINNNY